MGTIVKFKPNIDYYYTRGLNQFESDNFIDALKSYREAYKLLEDSHEREFRSVLELEMACCYRSLNLMRETQMMYYKAIAHGGSDSAFDGIIGLIDVFGASGNDDALRYYMNLAAKKGFGRDMDYIEAATSFFSQKEYRVEPSLEQNMFALGKKLLDAGQYEFARQLLEATPADSSLYSEANLKLAALYNSTGEHEKALDCLQKCQPNIETQLIKLLSLYKLGRTEEYEEIADEVACFDSDDISCLSHIIYTMAYVNKTELVIKFGRRLSQISPVKNAMLSYAIALSNSGDLRSARKVMVSLQALYPYDAAVMVYSRLISALTGASDFPLTGELPGDTEAAILDELNEVLEECGDDYNKLKESLRDPSLCMGILMIFQAGNGNSKQILANAVGDIPFFERYIRDCLIDPAFPEADKRILLPIALEQYKKRPVYLTCRDVCRPLNGKPPIKVGGKWRDTYYLAYSTLALLGCEKYEREFDATFIKLHNALSRTENLDEHALAALLAQSAKKVVMLDSDECCIELFDCDKDTFLKYKSKLIKDKKH